MVKISRLTNSDNKNAIYLLVHLHNENVFLMSAEKESKCVILEQLSLYSLIYVMRDGQTSKLEDLILNC